MNSKEILFREMFEKVGDIFSEQTISEKVNQFIKYGNVFLLFEVMSLRKEMEILREEVKSIRDVLELKNLNVPYDQT